MSGSLGHNMILASAGSGKTHTLVNRFIRLLALGVEPGRIIALTFTRKAAGEFLQKIFLRLSKAAADPEDARQLSSQVGLPGGGSETYRTLLARLVHSMADLQLGTIDQFFARIVGAFPYELGLTRPHRIMDDFEENLSRQAAMERLLAFGDEDRSQQILQLYKEMTWGAEEKQVYSNFEDKLKQFHSLYLEAQDHRLWGAAERIYKTPPWWFDAKSDLDGLLNDIQSEVATLALKKSEQSAFDAIIEAFTGWQPGMPLKMNTLYDRLLAAREALAGGCASVKIGRGEREIGEPLAGLLYRLLQVHVRGEVARRLLFTQSLGRLIAEYDRFYEQSIREAGSLVFADLPMLLIKRLCGGQAGISAEDIIYRLDGQIDHWLVDEFQDTSRIQWEVLSSFVDEVLQDPSGERTFFYVGDIKQSIYRWRGGDSRLFDEIYQRYATGEPGIERSVLSKSWRSAPPVLELVNTLFGKGITESLAGKQVAGRWNGLWQEHEASPRTASLAGYAAWGLLDAETDIEEGCIQLLKTLAPMEKGLSCAILVRRNADVTSLTQALREAGIPASMEGRVQISNDNLVGIWIKAAFTAMARPDESFAKEFLATAGFVVSSREYNGLLSSLRRALTGYGYAEAVRRVIAFVLPKLRPDPFLVRRAEQLLEAATRFEETGVQPIEHFVAFLDSTTVEESTVESQVQVMTVHKAKGLDFDIVLVAGFGNEPLVRPGNQGLHVQRENSGEVEWLLDLPNKLVLEQDPILSGADAAERNLNTFEALCLLYVAMTRARQGLYCLSSTPARNSNQLTWHALFENAFGGSGSVRQEGLVGWQFECGEPAWYEDRTPPAVEPRRSLQLQPLDALGSGFRTGLRKAQSPSQESHQEAALSPVLRSNAGRRFGTRMHDFLATIDWVAVDDPAALKALVSLADPNLRTRLETLLTSELGREVFAETSHAVDLWREKPYILRRQGVVATGIVDRAIIELSDTGQPVRATIYDFKTDALDPARPAQEQLHERYHVQLERYREAVSLLTGLPLGAVSTVLVPV